MSSTVELTEIGSIYSDELVAFENDDVSCFDRIALDQRKSDQQESRK